jgi:hypothetical protein
MALPTPQRHRAGSSEHSQATDTAPRKTFTGATTALIPTDLAKRIVDSGNGTWQGQERFRMADGSIRLAYVLNIRDVRIGSHVLHDVRASVADGDDMLLDFPTVNRIGPFTIDTRARELVFNIEQDADANWHPQRSPAHF